jgi:hypothetical protein
MQQPCHPCNNRVILSEAKDLVRECGLTDEEILRFAQDDN